MSILRGLWHGVRGKEAYGERQKEEYKGKRKKLGVRQKRVKRTGKGNGIVKQTKDEER